MGVGLDCLAGFKLPAGRPRLFDLVHFRELSPAPSTQAYLPAPCKREQPLAERRLTFAVFLRIAKWIAGNDLCPGGLIDAVDSLQV